LKTIVFEEDSRPGKFGKCTAIISRRGLDSLGVDYARTTANEVRGADIHAGKAVLRIRSREPIALVLERQEFDEECAAEAEREGAKIVYGQKVSSLDLGSRFVVGADGASSTVARLARFPEIPARKMALAYEAEYEECLLEDEKIVHVFLDGEKFPGFFGWLVPSGRSRARIGFATTLHEKQALGRKAIYEQEVVARALSGKPRKSREFNALIPLAARKQTRKENVLLAGDAAGQTKATTGGGIVFGGLCAKVAAQCIAANADYEKAWRSKYGGILAAHSFARLALDKTASLAEGVVALSALARANKLLELAGDMDYFVK
jgi:flavin-dependent dehydrogenase